MDWYGKDEAIARVEAGMVPVKKVGNMFLRVLADQAANEAVTRPKETNFCRDRTGSERTPSTQDEWKDLWSGKRLDKTFQLEDGISNTEQEQWAR